ncbi:hypothetical protein [Rhizobium metallidurans]|uniref:Uncharacterized protein n=1 Tax=Rhizobium metallidurans TaxID=1265931 RepID=A0A7W6GDR8_9HYPH|nr:hypothetical protein [Rhizobium metallidurans]MBB3967194.1 hypothetical protein [Rhizobium metallidurans]
MLHLFVFILVVLSTWAGGGSLSHIFGSFYLVILVALVAIGVVAIRVAAWAGLAAYSWLILIGLIGGSYMLGATFRFWALDSGTYRVTENVPIRVEVLRNEGQVTGAVRITNINRDPMLAAGVACRIFYDNGESVAKLFTGGFGRLAQLDAGYGATTLVVTPSDFRQYRSDPNLMRCWPTDATFVEPLPFNLELRFERNEKDGRTDFYVTNRDQVPLKNIQFNCVNDRDEPMKVEAYPAYQPNGFSDTIIATGKTGKFVSDSAVWKFRQCRVSNAGRAR